MRSYFDDKNLESDSKLV